jgi:hypothetical protein
MNEQGPSDQALRRERWLASGHHNPCNKKEVSMSRYEGKLETSFSEPYLCGDIYAKVYEKDGVRPTNIIRTDQAWGVKIEWELKGSLAQYICGEWCIHLCLESIGKGPELKWKAPEDIRLEPCGDGKYCYDFHVEPGEISAECCSIPYKPVVTVTYYSECHTPGPIAGYVELPILQFYEAGENHNHRGNGKRETELDVELEHALSSGVEAEAEGELVE